MSVWLLIQQFAHDKVHPWVFDCSSNNLLIIKFIREHPLLSSNKIWTSLYEFCISTEIFVFSQLLQGGWEKRELLCAYWAIKVLSYNCNFCYKSTLYNFHIMCGTKIYHYQKRFEYNKSCWWEREDDIAFSFCLFSSLWWGCSVQLKMKQHSHTCQWKAFFVQHLDASVPTLQFRDWEARLAFEVIFHVFLFFDFNAYKCQFWYCQGELKLCIPCRCPTILHNLCFLHNTVSWNSCNPHLQPNISTLGVLWFFLLLFLMVSLMSKQTPSTSQNILTATHHLHQTRFTTQKIFD